MSQVVQWSTVRSDGTQEIGTGGVPQGEFKSIGLTTSGGRQTTITLRPELGERARVFTRRTMVCGPNIVGTGDTKDTVVVEITPDPANPDKFVRMYINDGIQTVISTEDLYG
jgi:hypothetical protein